MKCKWCDNEATTKTYRTIDEMTGSSYECKECNNLDTNFLLKREVKE